MVSTAEIDDRIEKCQKILGDDPSSQIFAALAEAYRKKGELEKAFRICQNGLKIHAKYGSAHVVMAKINLDRGLYDWAEIEAQKAAEIDGHTRSIELLLAEIFIYKGEFNAAIKLLRKLHEADPGNVQITKLLEIAQRIPEEQTLVAAGRGGRVEVVREKRSAEKRGAEKVEREAPPRDETRTVKLNSKEVLLRSITIPGVDGAIFINREGLIVDAEWSLTLDLNTCGAVIGEIGNQVEKELIQNSFGSVKTVLIETQQPTFYMIKVSDGVFLFVANASANLGSLRMRVEKLLEQYQN